MHWIEWNFHFRMRENIGASTYVEMSNVNSNSTSNWTREDYSNSTENVGDYYWYSMPHSKAAIVSEFDELG